MWRRPLDRVKTLHGQCLRYAQAAAQPQAAAPAGGGTDLVAELQKLAALKDQGILSEDEFAAAKARLLG